MCESVKRPPVLVGSRDVHRRARLRSKPSANRDILTCYGMSGQSRRCGHEGHTPGAWKYFLNADDCYTVYPAGRDRHPRFPKTVIAEVCTRNWETREADARLIASAPEMRIALIGAVKALRATEVFMCGQGLETDNLNGIISTIDELLDRIDGTEA